MHDAQPGPGNKDGSLLMSANHPASCPHICCCELNAVKNVGPGMQAAECHSPLNGSPVIAHYAAGVAASGIPAPEDKGLDVAVVCVELCAWGDGDDTVHPADHVLVVRDVILARKAAAILANDDCKALALACGASAGAVACSAIRQQELGLQPRLPVMTARPSQTPALVLCCSPGSQQG